jgi:thiol reductant ABC exporter CydC subunit
MTSREDRLSRLLAPRDGELGRGLAAVGLGLAGQLAGVGLLASAAWLITTASLRPPVLTLTVAIAGVRLFALLRGTARYGERLASHDLALRALARMRVWAFTRLEPLVPGGWPGARRGDLLARFVADVDGLQDLYVRVALPFAGAVSTAVITVAAAALLDPEAGLVLGAGLVVATLAFPLFTAVAGAYGGTDRAGRRGDRDGLVVELLHGSPELTVFGAQAMMVTRVLDAERELARHDKRASVARGLGHGMGVALGGLLAAAVVAASLPAFDAGRISGVVVAVLGFLALGSAEAVSNLPESFAKLAGVLGGARRILALAPAERTSGKDASGLGTGSLPLVTPGRAPVIEISGVSVAYSSLRHLALEQVDLVLAAGEHVAVIGESGAGKTTLGHLLLGFVQPAHGRVTLDGADLRRLDPDGARRLVAWAPQDPHVFHTSLAANLRLARPQATDADLVSVLGQVGLGGWLDRLPAGLGTVLGERGNTVSGGQRQRLGVARALLADRPVLILDEPTAHLDADSESLLRAAVLAASTGKTLIWITHRLTGIDAFDEVITLHHGRVMAGEASRHPRRALVAESQTQGLA